jgi:hypothetical protein
MAEPLTIPPATESVVDSAGKLNASWYRLLHTLIQRHNAVAVEAAATVNAADVAYDDATSGLTADDVQEAIDEVEGRVDTLEGVSVIVEPIAAAAISAGATEVDIALGDYDLVEIDLMGIEPNTDNVSIFARFSQDNGANFLSGASDYGWGLSNAGTGAGDDADSEITLTGGIGNAAGERAFVTVRIFRPSASSFAKSMSWFGGYRTSAGVHTANHGWGHLLANTDAITHVRFLLESASTIDAGHYAARGYRFS